MLRPDVRFLLKESPLTEVIEEVERFIAEKPANELHLAKIDLLRLYGRCQQEASFYKLALFLVTSIKNPAIYREIARYAYFIEKDCNKAEFYARKAIRENKNEPLWVYYIARIPKTYFEKLYEGIYLTAIPKNASTSLKTMMLEEIHNKKDLNPHSVFGNPFFNTNNLDETLTSDDLKLISIREPISRFLSYYNKNIIEELSLKEELNNTKKDSEFGLNLTPELDEFVDKLNLYCYTFNDVLHHILPQTAYFNSLSTFDCVANIKDSHLLGEAVSRKLNLKNMISPPKKMVSKRNISEHLNMKPEIKNKIESLFSDDISAICHNRESELKYSFRF